MTAYKLSAEQMLEIENECLDSLCEDMSFPADECLELTDLAFMLIQGLTTCKCDTSLPCTEEVEMAGTNYLINLWAKTV